MRSYPNALRANGRHNFGAVHLLKHPNFRCARITPTLENSSDCATKDRLRITTCIDGGTWNRKYDVPMTEQLNAFFAAMSDPTRRAVIERLVCGPASVSELHAPHDMALPTFMRHLGVLEKTGIVQSVKKGRVRTCHIEYAPLIEAQGWLAWQRHLWEHRPDDSDKRQEQPGQIA